MTAYAMFIRGFWLFSRPNSLGSIAFYPPQHPGYSTNVGFQEIRIFSPISESFFSAFENFPSGEYYVNAFAAGSYQQFAGWSDANGLQILTSFLFMGPFPTEFAACHIVNPGGAINWNVFGDVVDANSLVTAAANALPPTSEDFVACFAGSFGPVGSGVKVANYTHVLHLVPPFSH